MDQFIAILTNPLFYTGILGMLVAFYAIWAMARQQYLGVDKLFNLLALSLAAGWFASWATQSLSNKIWEVQLNLGQLWVNPQPIVALMGYIGIWLVATRYIRSIRYPYWRLMDMLFVSLALLQSSLFIGWAIEQLSWHTGAAAVVATILAAALAFLYTKLQRSGIIAGLQSALLFGLLLALHFTVPTWQGQLGGVEWIADIVGIILGITLVALRISARSEKAILQDIPRGVSQSFHETFTRAFAKKGTDQKVEK